MVKGAPASPSGSHPAGHAACGVDGASRFDPSRWQYVQLTGDYEQGDWKVGRWHDERDNWYPVYFRGREVAEFRNDMERALRFPSTERGQAIAIETEGQDREDGLGAEHESAAPKGIAHD